MFVVSKNFYEDYLRTMFDLDNNTFTQGWNKKYGLLVNNGFETYALYFKLYSAYKHCFYNTNYGNVFNYDYSVYNNYDISQNGGNVFNDSNLKLWVKL